MKYCIKIFFITLAVANNFTARAYPFSADTSINKISSITIASEPDYPPYCIIDKNGKAAGFSVELFLAAAKVVNIDVSIQIGVWNHIKQDLADGKIDALPLVGKTPEREAFYDFTMPYLRLHGSVFVNKRTTKINSIDDLKKLSVAIMKGDNAEEYVRRKNLTDSISTTHTFEDAFRLLSDGKVDAVVIQRIVGLELIKSMGLKNVIPLNLELPDFRQDFCFAVKKGNVELLDQLNEGLSIVIANKTYDDIHHKWFGPSLKEKISFGDVLRIGTNILIPLILISSLILIYLLRRLVRERTKGLRIEIEEHKKTFTELKRNQLLLEKMERVSQVGGWDYNIKTQKLTWTKGVYAIYAVSPEEFDPSSKDIDLNFYNPNDRKILEMAFHQLLVTGEPYDLELRFIDAKGVEKWVWTSGQAEYQSGEIVRVFGSIMDVTESKVAELKVVESELRMREIFNSTNEAIIVHDTSNGEILDCNDSTLKIYGYSAKEELLNKNIGDISLDEHPYTQAEAIKMIKKAINEGSHTFEWVCRKRNGSTFWCEVSLRYTEINNQKRVLAVVRDTSERKEIEAKLQEQKQIFYHLMENSPIYLFFKDENIRAIMLSRNYEQMLNRPLNEILGKTMDELFPFELAKRMIEDDKKILNEGKTIVVDEELNGRFYTTIKFPIIINQKPRYLAGYTIDITDRKKTEQELLSVKNNLEKIVEDRTKELEEQIQKLDKSQKAMLYMVEDLNSMTKDLISERKKLEISNKELEAFSYSVSHDLRAPLRAVDGFSRMIMEDYSNVIDSEGKRLLGIVRENVQKMDKLITDLLSLSRVSRTEISLSRIDMAGMANSMFHEVIGNENAEKVAITIGPLPEIYADTTLMRQVWQNLIGNALKYSKPKEKQIIEIYGSTENGVNTYCIKDNGVGFNPGYKLKIFDTFQRLHKANEFEGTGIGLSIVHRIITRHGGNVWADSVEGEGATFCFSLPVREG